MSIQSECLFCKMVAGLILVVPVFEDSKFICIRDIDPKAKIHLLLIPKEHVSSLQDAFPQSGGGRLELLGQLFETANRVAWQENLLPGGFRSVINTGKNACQTIFHLHLHLLGGELLDENC